MPAEPPLCVDLDGTLIEGDTLMISVRHLAREAPWTLLALPFVLLGGRPALKAFVARRYVPHPESLVWRSEVLTFIREQPSLGRQPAGILGRPVRDFSRRGEMLAVRRQKVEQIVTLHAIQPLFGRAGVRCGDGRQRENELVVVKANLRKPIAGKTTQSHGPILEYQRGVVMRPRLAENRVQHKKRRRRRPKISTLHCP